MPDPEPIKYPTGVNYLSPTLLAMLNGSYQSQDPAILNRLDRMEISVETLQIQQTNNTTVDTVHKHIKGNGLVRGLNIYPSFGEEQMQDSDWYNDVAIHGNVSTMRLNVKLPSTLVDPNLRTIWTERRDTDPNRSDYGYCGLRTRIFNVGNTNATTLYFPDTIVNGAFVKTIVLNVRSGTPTMIMAQTHGVTIPFRGYVDLQYLGDTTFHVSVFGG